MRAADVKFRSIWPFEFKEVCRYLPRGGARPPSSSLQFVPAQAAGFEPLVLPGLPWHPFPRGDHLFTVALPVTKTDQSPEDKKVLNCGIRKGRAISCRFKVNERLTGDNFPDKLYKYSVGGQRTLTVHLVKGFFAMLKSYVKTTEALKRLRTDRDGVVSFEYIIVAFCIVAAVAAVFGATNGGGISSALNTALGTVLSVFANAAP
jgi:hypothetical protein